MVNPLNGIDRNSNGIYQAVSGTEYLTFELERLRDGVYGDVGIIRVDDAEGRIGGYKPTDSAYISAIFSHSRWTSLIGSYEGIGAKAEDWRVDPNSYYIFGMVSGADFAAVRDNREYNRLVLSTHSGKSWQWETSEGIDAIAWGINSYEDMVLQVKRAEIGQSLGGVLPGLGKSQYWRADEAYEISFNATYRQEGSEYEFGLFEVDDESGRIGNLRPGQRGYAEAAINRRVQVLSQGQGEGVVKVEKGKVYSSYIISGGSSADWLRENRGNSLMRPIRAFFDRPLDNPDKQEHISWRDGEVYIAGGLDRNMHDLKLRWQVKADIKLSATSTNENVGIGTVIGKFSGTNNFGNYELVSGGDSSAFEIVENELRWKVSPDYEAKDSYSITVRNGYARADFTISVKDVNEAPLGLVLGNREIAENSGINGLVGRFSTVGDPDRDELHSYSLVGGDGSTDNNAFTIVNGELRMEASADYEVKKEYSIRVRTTDKGGLYVEDSFIIRVTNVNEAPFNLQLSNNSTAENVAVGTVIGSFSSQDVDASDSATYSLVEGFGDNASFSIEGNQLKWGIVPDFEAKNSYSIKVRVTDAGGLTAEREFTIGVTNVNEAPFNLQLSNNSTAENVAVGTVIGSFSSQDVDAGDSATYSLVEGFGDNASFSIEGNQLKWGIYHWCKQCE